MSKIEDLVEYQHKLSEYNSAVKKNAEINAKITIHKAEIKELEDEIERLKTAKYKLIKIVPEVSVVYDNFNKEIDNEKYKGSNENRYDSVRKKAVLDEYKKFSDKVEDIYDEVIKELSKKETELSNLESDIRRLTNSKVSATKPTMP